MSMPLVAILRIPFFLDRRAYLSIIGLNVRPAARVVNRPVMPGGSVIGIRPYKRRRYGITPESVLF